ncbi:trypsin-like peptidase domain-containing protein [Streptomyces sp. NPDC003344]|uniref:VMAP-C domain-containing protein n=2 Tax=unclassified Streptomyces TaxID=2593676 RepID=UPI003690D47F
MSAFDEMVRPSLARIGAAGDGYATDRDPYWGSGFFVAPGWLLTCAHVVGKGGAAVCRGENALRVTWQERTDEPAADAWGERSGTGTAVLLAPRPEDPDSLRDPWPFPDLALVRVEGADDVRCLWLGDREPGARAPLGLYGWSLQTGELGVRHGTGELAGSDARALLLGGSLPIGGLSGGPVLDLRQGSVVGVIKGRRREEGVAVPVTALHELLDRRDTAGVLREVLRAHDRHHLSLLDDPSPYANWTTLQAGLSALAPPVSGITAELRARLYAHLAELPPPAGAGEIVHLVEEVKERVRGERLRSLVPRNVRTWREGAALLYGLRTLDSEGGGTLVDLDAVLLYAAVVLRKTVRERPGETDPARLGAFTEWLGAQAGRHRHWAVGGAIRGLLEGIEGRGPDGGPAGRPADARAVGAGDGRPDGANEAPREASVEAPDARRTAAATPATSATPETAAAPGASAAPGVSAAPGASAASGTAAAPPSALTAPAGSAPPVAYGLRAASEPSALPGPRFVVRESPPVAAGTVTAGRTDVLVRIGASMYGGLHPWSVELIHDGLDVTPVAADDRGARVEELAAVLRAPLDRALNLGDHGEHLAGIEVFLPRKLFDLPVDEWQLLPEQPGAFRAGDRGHRDGLGLSHGERAAGDDGGDGGDDDDDDFVDERSMPLGMRRTVVIRDLRRNERPAAPEWRKRWRGVAGGPLTHEPLHGRSPADGHVAAARSASPYLYYSTLSVLDHASVPVYCGPVASGEGQAAMREALMAGHPVVLWRRDGHDHDECKDFYEQAAHVVGAARHAEGLHEPVRELRIRLHDPESARARGLHGKLAVLFDPPDRPPRAGGTMRPPPLAAPDG